MKRKYNYKSAAHKRKVLEHKAWLASLKPKKRTKAPRILEDKMPSRNLPPTSDKIFAIPTITVDEEYQKAVDEKAKRVAPMSNKQGLTYYGEDLDGIKNSGRGRFFD